MARGGYRPGAGRPRKSLEAQGVEAPSKSEVLEDENQPKGRRKKQTPLEYMVDVMNDPKASEARRDRMAFMAAPFVHGKVAEVGGGKKDQLKKKAEELASGGGKFAARSGPRLAVSNK